MGELCKYKPVVVENFKSINVQHTNHTAGSAWYYLLLKLTVDLFHYPTEHTLIHCLTRNIKSMKVLVFLQKRFTILAP